MNILALNAGGSSLKFRVYALDALRPLTEEETALATGYIEQIGGGESRLQLTVGGQESETPIQAEDVAQAVSRALEQLWKRAEESGTALRVDAAGVRVVHGGPDFTDPVRVDTEVIARLSELVPLAPLHLPGGIAAIEALRETLPDAPCIAVFDSAFHHDLPRVASLYALPRALSERHHLRRYGFHGISYRYVVERALLAMTRPVKGTKLILCHLGGGASVCAVRNGRSMDTSMGFTPLEGLMMGTRVGDIDAGLVLYLIRTLGCTPDQVDKLLNKESGLLGVSGGISSDTRELARADDDPAAEEALEVFAYRVRKYIGAYAAALGGADALIFTDKIGSTGAGMRARICRDLEFLGFGLSEERNRKATGDMPLPIGGGDGGRVWVVPNDEERQIAREAFALLTGAHNVT